MFSFKATNAYDSIVEKATDENLTSEQWDTNLTICDKVDLEGESGARQVVASIQKRFLHRSANVQLYALTLTDALVSNCKAPLHREVASSAFTESIKRLALDRNAHAQVKKRAAFLVKKWANDFARDERLDIMQDAYEQLKQRGLSFDDESSTQARPDREQEENALARMEEENIQRAIRESEAEAEKVRQKQQQNQTNINTLAETSFGPAGQAYPNANGYVPAATSSVPLPASSHHGASSSKVSRERPATQPISGPSIQRARALYDFDPDPNQPGELPLRKGDTVRILDRAYAEWWKGECRNRVGIFPVNWVQILPEPTPEEMWAEAQMEANVFAQVGNVDRLLELLRAVEERGDMSRIGDDDEITDLYQQCITLRPKILKLIDKYTQKKTEFLDINSKFVEAKRTYESMLDDSWSHHQPNHVHSDPYQQGYPAQMQYAQMHQHAQPVLAPPASALPPQAHPAYNDAHANLQPAHAMHGQMQQPAGQYLGPAQSDADAPSAYH